MFSAINKWLDGKKTLIAGIAGLLTTISAFLVSLNDGLQTGDLITLGTGFAASMTVLGFGGKFEKFIKAAEALK